MKFGRSMRSAGAVFCVGLVTIGCTTTKYAGPVATPAAVAQVRLEQPDSSLEVFVHGTPQPVRPVGNLLDLDDQTAKISPWMARDPGAPLPPLVLPTGTIRRIRTVDHGKGALQGAGIGVLIGVAVGALAFLTTPACPPNEFLCFGPRETAFIGTVGVGVPALLLGTLAGALAGSHTDYVFGN